MTQAIEAVLAISNNILNQEASASKYSTPSFLQVSENEYDQLERTKQFQQAKFRMFYQMSAGASIFQEANFV